MSDPMRVVTTFAAEAETDGWVTRRGKLFHAGAWPDKALTLTEADLDAEVAAFAPVDLEIEHYQTRGLPSIFDGKLGQIDAIWREGADLIARARVPAFVDACWADKGHRISAVWDTATRRLLRAGLVLNPAITDAALTASFAAFAGQRHSAADLRDMQQIHDLTTGQGATCDPAHCPTPPGPSLYSAGPSAPKEHHMSRMDEFVAWLRGEGTENPLPAAPPAGTSVPPGQPDLPGGAAAFAAERTRLDAERAAFAAERAAFARAQYLATATAKVNDLLAAGKVIPAQNLPGPDGTPALVAAFAQDLADDAAGAATFAQAGGSRFAARCAAFDAAPGRDLSRETLPGDAALLPNRTTTPNAADTEQAAAFAATDAAAEAFIANLPGGPAILAERRAGLAARNGRH
jgi:hypothetical protein